MSKCATMNRVFALFVWTLWLVTIAVNTAGNDGTNFADLDQYLDPFDPNPRFIVKNGHLLMLTGRNKDLVFRSSGAGRVKINGEDISALKQAASSDNRAIDAAQSPSLGPSKLIQFVDRQVALVENRMKTRLQSMNTTVQFLRKLNAGGQRRTLRNLVRKVNRLERLLNKNECESSPCQNGGVCEDGYNRYLCRCADGFTGRSCEQDVDECAHYQGTELGCQHGGTCLNTFGAFHCLCPANYRGLRCTIEFNDCRNTSSHELCGNGVCFDLPRTQTGVARYRCVCYQGFGKSVANSESAPCDTDVDECATGQHRCSRTPPVTCVNTRAGYTCGPCPVGYTGDGYACTPVDLCRVNNGGCSLSPRVSCFADAHGRVVCGSCPAGFVGDGVVCSQIDGDICSANNGGCHSAARCVANRAISATYRDCVCPVGQTGAGVGPNGCTPITTGPDAVRRSCAPINPCANQGVCTQFRDSVYCECAPGFSGPYCQQSTSVCTPNPCANGGVCAVTRPGTYRCTCTSEFTGRQCELARSQCGGELDSATGTLTFPLSNGSTYANNISCVWVIRNSNAMGKVLNLTFTSFKVESSNRCAFDYVELFDGPTREYKSWGRFCGNQLPRKTGNFRSSFGSVLLQFRSDSSVGREGFALNWKTVDPSCGGFISNRSHGMLESPGYPHHYPQLLDCRWQIMAQYGKRIQFVFNHLDLEAQANCTFDYLEFKEGSSHLDKGTTIARFCNWTASADYTVPPPVTTSGSFARVHFHSDAGVSARGFQVLFHQVPGICGGLLTGASGIFRPPTTSYTSSVTGLTTLMYENNVVCDWLIRVLPEERISLRFLAFSLEADTMVINRGGSTMRFLTTNNVPHNLTSTCVFDYVEVYDGEDFNAPLRARLCGRITPPEIISSGRFLRVKFRSDMSVSARGFTAQYSALCGGEFNEPQGVVKSPNYPAPLVYSRNCTYVLHAPVGHIIKFELESMDIEYDRQCLFDYLLVEGQRLCGSYPPPPIYSATDEMRITFVNDDTKPSKGFRARYSSVEIGCGGTLKQGDPIIAITPENIKDNPLVNQCLWEIRANQSYIVSVKFFHPETATASPRSSSRRLYTRTCSFNSTYIMVNNSDGSLIKRFCPDELPPLITSTGTKLFITYVFRQPLRVASVGPIEPNVTNLTSVTTVSSTIPNWFSGNDTRSALEVLSRLMSNFETKTFYANYFFIKARNFCSGNLFANTGRIRSPEYPRRYPPNRNCTWVIHVDNGLQIKLNVTTFQLEPMSEVNGQCYDYLEVRNGKRPDSPLVGKFCGNGPLPNIVSHSNYLFLRFVSDSSMQNRGFQLYYQALETGCGGVLTGDSGLIESPDYPNTYFSNSNCEWKIRVAEGSVIVVTIVAIDIEATPDGRCRFDFLELFDGDSDAAHSMGRFCTLADGRNELVSTSNRMFLRFTTDATINHGGFRLSYRTRCNRTLTGRYGVIESPGYPYPHPHNLNCNWHILAPMGNNVTVSFTELTLETGIDCMFDRINISEVNRFRPLGLNDVSHVESATYPYNLTSRKVLCGNFSGNLPPQIKLATNEAVIQFYSDESRSMQSGFRLEWGTDGCGGEYINRASGQISSPGFPNPYPRDVECLWHIKAPDGNRVDLSIDTLDMEYSKSCTFDYVQIFGGPDENSPEIIKLCNQASDRHISSVGSSMTIKLASDISMSRRGFLARFTTDQPGCGGLFSTDSGTLTSPNYGRGNQYDASSDCAYRIRTADNLDIEITINDFQIANRTANCSDSYLAIYDAGSEAEGKLLVRLCGDMSATNGNSSTFRSTGNELFVRFKGNGANSGRGFNATYRTVCGGTVTVSSQDNYQTIASIGYPHIVSNDDQCRFVLKAANPADTVTVRFTHIQSFNLPFEIYPRAANECTISYMEFYEGREAVEHKRRSRYCLQTIPPPIVSTGDSLLLVTHYTVFKALVSSAKSSCGGDFNAIEGFVTNPGYPNNYPLNIECIWVLNASPGNRYVLELVDFDLEDSEYCNGDYLEIRLGNSSGPVIGDRRLCGNNKDDLPSIDFSYSGSVWIKFRSDDATVGKGFLLHFQTASNVILNGDSGQVASPGYPSSFHFYNRTFTWSITVSPKSYVKLDFVELDLIGDSGSFGFCIIQLSVYNGFVDFNRMESLSNQKQVFSTFQMSTLPEPKSTYCSSLLPSPFVSDNNVVTLIYFAPYYSHLPTKFLLNWTAINQTEAAAFDEHSEGIPSGVNSTFSVFIEKGQQFNLINDNFTEFGNDINWFFTTQTSMHFNVSVALFTFLPSSFGSCWFNKLTIYHWHQTGRRWNIAKKLCNGFSKTIELAGSNMIRMHLQFSKTSESGVVRPRYNMTIFPVCGGNFTEPSGTIDLNDARDGRGSNQCRWLIKVRPGRTIQISVEYFSIGYQTIQCSNQYLQLRNGQSDDSPLLMQPLCGHNTTMFDTPETSGNDALILWKSTSESNNFRLHYREVGLECGGELVLRSATDVVTFASPDYPESPAHDLTCEWVIRGPLDTGLQLSFAPERWADCNLNNSYVEVFNGGSDLAGRIGRYCTPPYNPNSVIITNHIAFVRFVMKRRDFHSKFNATIKADNCNREYFISGRMKDLQLPSLRPNSVAADLSARCSIRIRTHPYFYIIVNLTSLYLEGSNCSAGDVVEFRDSEDSAFAFNRFCAPRNSSTFDYQLSSMDNELLIVYQRINFQAPFNKTNLRKIGVKFSVQTKYRKCVRTINAKQYPTGVIRSPNFPSAVNRRFHCYWRLIAEVGSRIVLNFNRFNLGWMPTNLNISMLRCSKKLLVWKNLFEPRNMVTTFGCSNEVPGEISSLTHMMSMSLIANELKEREGFSLSYRVVHDNESCSEYLDSLRGQLVSANFDNLNYSGPVGCAWDMKVGVNQSGTILLDTYDVEGDCTNSSLNTAGVTDDSQNFFWTIVCITKENTPQSKGSKFLLPVYRRLQDSQNPMILFSFKRTIAGQSKGLSGQYFIQQCGGFFEDFEGEIASPNYPNSYNESFCNWYFGLTQSSAKAKNFVGYRLTFTEFDIGDNCEEEYFFIKPRFDQTITTKLCKRDGIPKPLYVAHDLLISFVSSRNLSLPAKPSTAMAPFSGKFKFRLDRAAHGCGGLLLSSSGYFQSPNYAHLNDTFLTNRQYGSNLECVWTIRAIGDFHLTFQFNSRFDLEESANCTRDYLLLEERLIDVIDGREQHRWSALGRLCGHKKPAPMTSRTNLVRATFRTNDRVVGDGFRVEYSQECGGLFQAESGTVTSPHYSQGAYGNGLSCVYEIVRAPHEYIRVVFDDFELESHASCLFDSVSVFLGNHTASTTPKYGPFCGATLPPSMSSQGKLVIVFMSDGYLTKRGFKLHYEVTGCGGNLTEAAGTIVSPEITRDSYKLCAWRITAPEPNNAVSVRITDLDLANEHCNVDCCNYLKVHDGFQVAGNLLGYLCTNNHEDLVFKSSGPELLVYFRRGSLESDKAARFRLEYWSSPGPKAGCGGVLSGAQGVVTSPDIDGDSNYEPNLSCVWTVSVANFLVQYVELAFERFDLERGNETQGTCDNDYLAVYDGVTLHSPLLAKLCGVDVPERLRSTGETLLLHLVTNDNNVTGHGFRARFTVHNRTCGGALTPVERPQVLQSPNYPNGYDSPLDCVWSFPQSYSYYRRPVVLTFTDLDLNCTRGDYVQVAESRTSTYDSTLFRPITLCSSPGKVKIVSVEQLSVVMKVSPSAHVGGVAYDNQNFAVVQTAAGNRTARDKYRGFALTYHSSLCNESLTGLENGYVYNRNYPQPDMVYPIVVCMINISVAADRQIALYFSSFSFYHCQYSNLTVFEGNSSTRAKATFCNSVNAPAPIFSTSNSVRVVIRAAFMSRTGADYNKPNYRTNRLVYAFNYVSSLRSVGPPGCGGNLTAPRGVFSSPYYPSALNQDQVCTWLIHANGYHTVSLRFQFFQLSPNCQNNYVTVYDGDEAVDDKKLATFCTNDKPAIIRSQSNALLVKLFTVLGNYEPGFLASYQVNTNEPKIRGRVITSQTFKLYRFLANSTYFDL